MNAQTEPEKLKDLTELVEIHDDELESHLDILQQLVHENHNQHEPPDQLGQFMISMCAALKRIIDLENRLSNLEQKK